MTDYRNVQSAIAAKGSQPQTALDALCALSDATFGLKLCTISLIDPMTEEGIRVYSNMPDDFPLSGRKPRADTYWSKWVLDDQKTFVANDSAGIEEVFFDHELIKSLGMASVINVPIVVNGSTIGSVNCLHEAGHYIAERVAASENIKLPAAACLLLVQAIEAGGL